MSDQLPKPVCAALGRGVVLVLLLMLVWVFVLPRLAESSKAKVPQIVANLKQIEMAKRIWALDRAATNGVAVTEQELMQYLKVPGRTGLVAIVDSEVYRVNQIGTPPEAQLQKAFGPAFPKETLIRWSANAGTEILLPNPQGGANGWKPLYSGTDRMPGAAAPPVAHPDCSAP